MSVGSEFQPAEALSPGTPAAIKCETCGLPLAADQEWCLECGSAQTLIHRAPDWRVPVAVIATVLTLVLAAFAIALINLSSNANRTAAITTVTQPAPASPAAPKPPTARQAKPAGPRIAGWAVGLPGWTVALASGSTRAGAHARAAQLARAGIRVGVLNSSLHPSMTPGRWIVFSGRYPTPAAAQARASLLRARGQAGATVTLVGASGA